MDARTDGIDRYGAPEIVNADQGSQCTSKAWTDVLDAAGVRISMDGEGRWIDNVFIERLWRSVKYEDIYLRAYENGRDLQARLARYFDFYNRRRIHQSHDYQTPDETYYVSNVTEPLAIAAIEIDMDAAGRSDRETGDAQVADLSTYPRKISVRTTRTTAIAYRRQ